MQSVCESIGYMQQLCGETGLNVTQGKRVQRQVRYDKLKVEFSNFCEKLLNGDSESNIRSNSQGRLIQDMEADRGDYKKKVELYKDQVKKMRQNMELFKQNIK